jgi:hypothetical protein
MYFSNENRPLLKSRNPSMTFQELGVKIGEMWVELSDKGKKPYLKLSSEDKKRYDAEKAEVGASKK